MALLGLIAMAYQPKAEMVEIDNPDFHVCDTDDCLNSYTPFKAPGGNRYCLTCAHDD